MKAPSRAWRDARPWLADTPVCDGLLPWTAHFLPPGADLVETLRRFHASGFDHISVTAAAGKDDALTALSRVGFLLSELRRAPDSLRHAASPADILAAKAAGQLSVSLHFQTATPFTTDFSLVSAFKAAGIDRAIIAYNQANTFGDGCHEPRDAGLTAAGGRLLREMDAAGMIVDLSHCGERTSYDALATGLTRTPVFSHSNARALFDHERNISDDLLREAGRSGAYVGISGVGMFLGAAAQEIPRAMAEQAAHIASLIGADKVGLGVDFMLLEGSDYGFFDPARYPRGYPPPPWDFLQPEQLPDLVQCLEDKGFSQTEMMGILGGNYLKLAA